MCVRVCAWAPVRSGRGSARPLRPASGAPRRSNRRRWRATSGCARITPSSSSAAQPGRHPYFGHAREGPRRMEQHILWRPAERAVLCVVYPKGPGAHSERQCGSHVSKSGNVRRRWSGCLMGVWGVCPWGVSVDQGARPCVAQTWSSALLLRLHALSGNVRQTFRYTFQKLMRVAVRTRHRNTCRSTQTGGRAGGVYKEIRDVISDLLGMQSTGRQKLRVRLRITKRTAYFLGEAGARRVVGRRGESIVCLHDFEIERHCRKLQMSRLRRLGCAVARYAPCRRDRCPSSSSSSMPAVTIHTDVRLVRGGSCDRTLGPCSTVRYRTSTEPVQ